MNEFATKLGAVVEQFSNDAPGVDATSSIPADHVDRLAATGLYGAFAPVADGGLGLSFTETCSAVEMLASACVTSTFVWIQHFRLLAAVLSPEAPATLRSQLSKVVSGETKGGVALGGQLPGPARLRATRAADGWAIDGEAPWVSGWGLIDTLLVASRGPDDTVVTFVIEAREQPGLVVARRRLSAMNASATVHVTFESLVVERFQVIGIEPHNPGRERPEGLRVNGSLALGLTRRCCGLLGPTPLDDELENCRGELDNADNESMPIARARASELAVRAAHALSVQRGSSSVLEGDVGERTTREASLLLTFGSRPGIRRALLERFGAAGQV